MTPFWITYFFPTSELDIAGLVQDGWKPGPAFSGRGASDDRTFGYDDPRTVESLVAAGSRCHIRMDVTIGNLRVVALEGVHSSVDRRGRLVVHVEMKPDGKEISALTQAGQVARPRRAESAALIEAAGAVAPGAQPRWRLLQVPRVPTLAFSETPNEADAGLIRWEGSTPSERRAASLTVLRKDSVTVPHSFDLTISNPTPSHDLAVSGTSMVVLRLRNVRPDHVERFRSRWMDAFLLELIQAEAVSAVVADVKRAAGESTSSTWKDLEGDFQLWRSREGWGAGIDLPMEAAIARSLREALRTDAMLDRVDSDLRIHAERERRRIADDQIAVNEKLTRAVMFLTIATVVTPVILAPAGQETDVWFYTACAVSAVVLVACWLIIYKKR